MNPPLYNKYRVIKKEEDLKHLEEEINYNFPLNFSREFYLNNIKKYEVDKLYIEKLIYYYRNKKEELNIPMSINERSFSIWKEEKFLKDGGGKSILSNLGIPLETLNIYTTPEPFVYFTNNKNTKQNVLILENKDTWYTIRKLMIEGQNKFLGENIDTIIYGRGKNIERSLEEYEFTVEEHLLNPDRVLYWGDIDYEGMGIYNRLKERYSEKFDIKLFKNAYTKMIEKSINIKLPIYKEKQNKNVDDLFLNEIESYRDNIMSILDRGEYIPQEIISYLDLRGE
jgi:hypothetical protein